MGNSKIPHQPSVHVNFQDVTLGDIIKVIFHQFDFWDTNNDPYNIDTTSKGNFNDGNGNDDMIISKLSKSYTVSTTYI